MWLIHEHELKEKFIKGGGPGGQKINKTNSKVQLTHLPTGIVVKSQYLRDQSKNRAMARELLALKLEQHQDPANCRLQVIADYKAKQRRNKMRRARKRNWAKEREGDEAEAEAEMVDIEAELNMLIEKHNENAPGTNRTVGSGGDGGDVGGGDR